MALGLNTESGDFVPFVKFDARAGRWFRKAKDGEAEAVDITDSFVAVFDFSTIEVGWMMFTPGAAPLYVTRPWSQGVSPKPPGDFRQGFKMQIVLADHLGGGVHELASTAKAVGGPIDRLHDAFLEALEGMQGKLPIYRMAGVVPKESKGRSGTTRNYEPKLELVEWVDRPASLGGQPAVAKPAAHVTPVPAATGSTQVTPPAAKIAEIKKPTFG